MQSIYHHVGARKSAKKHHFLSYEKNSTVIKQGRGALSVEERCQAQECLALTEINADIFGHGTAAVSSVTR